VKEGGNLEAVEEEEEEYKCSKIYNFVSVSLRPIYTGNFGYTF